MPRPTELTPEIAAAVCERLSEVGSLRRVCADPSMPLERTVRRWYTENEEFASAYARAKEAGIDALVDETLDLADERAPSTAQGATDSGHVAWNKVRIETRRWLAERMMPKKYGVRSATEISGPDGGPVKVTDETQTAARLAQLVAIAQARKNAAESAVSIDDLV